MSSESHHSVFGFLSHGHRQPIASRGPSAEILLGKSRAALLGEERENVTDRGHARSASSPVVLEGYSVQQLQQNALEKSQETTSAVQNCLKVAEEMRQGAAKTMEQLHEQREQIRRTHETALVFEQELSKGEKLLASLGGLFSKPWRPKRGHEIAGPVDFQHVPHHTSPAPVFQTKDAGGILSRNNASSTSPDLKSQQSAFQAHVQTEIAKQDEALSDLSNVLDQLKSMSIDMGTEIQNQNQSLDRLHDDVNELEFRLKNANEREKQLLRR